MRNVVRALTRRDHTITGTLLRRPFAAASCKAINKAIDSTPVMETAVTATPAIAPAAFSAVSLAGLESATNRSHLEMPRLHIAAFFFWVTLHLEISAWSFVACEGVCREKAFLCANSVVLGVSVVELLKKTLT